MKAGLRWLEGQRFDGEIDGTPMVIDGGGDDAPSPMQAVALGLLGCMAIDVVEILRKGRHDLQGLEASVTAERADGTPRRFVKMTLHYKVTGGVAPDKVERAIALSRETYCSVWHSLRQDIELETSFEVAAG